MSLARNRMFSIYFILTILLSSGFSLAQNMAPPLNHPLKVHVDPAQKKIFWPYTQPVWIRLATSADPNAPSFLLDRVSSYSGEKAAPNYSTKGIELEMTGSQYLRWFNAVSKDTLLLEFYADGDAPVTTASFLDAPAYSGKKTQFYGVGLNVDLTSKDPMSGVETIYASIDGAVFNPYSSKLNMGQEKKYSLRYYAVDNVGNAAKPIEQTFQVDLTTPSSSYKLQSGFIGDVLSPKAKIQLSSEDALSGVNRIYYSWDNDTKPQVFNSPLSVDHLKDGTHTLTFYSIDNVENREKNVTYSFYYDAVPPSVSASVDGDEYVSGSTRYISPRARLVLNATDNKIGVDKIEHTFGKDFTKFERPITIPREMKGKATLSYKAVDLLGNTSNVDQFQLLIDTDTPESKCDFIGTSVKDWEISWITSRTQIKLTSSDPTSGVKETIAMLAGHPQNTYTKPFNIEQEGGYVLKYWSLDNVNNMEPPKTMVVFVDNTPPTIFHFFSINSKDSIKVEGGAMAHIYPTGTQFFITSTDAVSGIGGLWYKLDGDPEKEFKTPIYFEHEGQHKLVIRTRDKVLNEVSQTIYFIIKD